jgi:hypothetical protein
MLEKEFVQTREGEPDEWVPTAQNHGLVASLNQRLRLDRRADDDRLARLDLQAIIGQQVGPASDYRVAQS